ncbi:MAG: hypothetical protein H7222_11055 [Methylotenera sp.]|nr:hypothetical protein [Oligoflexia bacterium]
MRSVFSYTTHGTKLLVHALVLGGFIITALTHPAVAVAAAPAPDCTSGTPTIRLDHEYVDDRKSAPGPLYGAPTLNQGRFGACYAIAATTLLQAKMARHPELSFFDFAINVKAERAESHADAQAYFAVLKAQKRSASELLDVGEICDGIEKNRNYGVCRRSSAYLEESALHRKDPDSLSNAVESLAQLFDDNWSGGQDVFAKRWKKIAPQLNELNLREITQGFDSSLMAGVLDGAMKELSKQVSPDRAGEFQRRVRSSARKFSEELYVPGLLAGKSSEELCATFAVAFASLPDITTFIPNANCIRLVNDERKDSKTLAILRTEDQFRRQIATRRNELLASSSDPALACRLSGSNAAGNELLRTLHDLNANLTPVVQVLNEAPGVTAGLRKALAPECLDQKNRLSIAGISCTKHSIHSKLTDPTAYLNHGTQVLRKLVKDRMRPSVAQPVGVTFCPDILVQPTDPNNTHPGCKRELHAAVIIGFRKNPTASGCQYLIQNSWGTDCRQYIHPELCENGKIWVDEYDLARNMTGLNTLHQAVSE